MNKRSTNHSVRSLKFTYRQRHIEVLLDKVLLFRFVKNLHGRFWGVASINVLVVGFSICFLIRPDLLHISTAFSDFGNDIRTAPYFSGTVFFTAYGLWRWRNYLRRTWRRGNPVTSLITLTMLGLYLVALMPVSWQPLAYYIHMFGVGLAGCSMLATVILDALLTKTPPHDQRIGTWRSVRLLSLTAIIAGGWLTLGSTQILGLYNVALLGESLLIAGYCIWIVLKTYQGEGNNTVLAHLLSKFVSIR